MLISASDVFPDFILEQFGQFVLTIWAHVTSGFSK